MTYPQSPPPSWPGQPSFDPGMYPAAPQPPPAKNRVVLIVSIIAGAIVLCCVGVVVVLALAPAPKDGTDPGSTTAADGGTGNPTGNPGLNKPARDGAFEFVVKALTCGKAQLGSGGYTKTAQGQYCLAEMTVRNVGTEQQKFDGELQKASDGSGVRYSNDLSAEGLVNKEDVTYYEQVNPGNSLDLTLVFDIPKTAKITSLELHDSPYSKGVTVDVTQ